MWGKYYSFPHMLLWIARVLFFFGFSYNTFLFFLFLFFFLKIIFVDFIFLILSWLKITVTICGESTVAFLANYCGLLQCFFPHVFFIFFFSNCLCQFYFLNIELFKNYNYKKIQIRLNYVGKTL
jgi:hypothetical protein